MHKIRKTWLKEWVRSKIYAFIRVLLGTIVLLFLLWVLKNGKELLSIANRKARD